MKKPSASYWDIKVINVFIGILLIGITMPVFLSGDALEDKYKAFMSETKVSSSPETASNTNEKIEKDILHQPKATKEDVWIEKDEYTTFVDSDNQQGFVVRNINRFFSWIKSFSAGSILASIIALLIYSIIIISPFLLALIGKTPDGFIKIGIYNSYSTEMHSISMKIVYLIYIGIAMLFLIPLFINDVIFYFNPMAIFGFIWDAIILWFKVLFAIFGWYI